MFMRNIFLMLAVFIAATVTCSSLELTANNDDLFDDDELADSSSTPVVPIVEEKPFEFRIKSLRDCSKYEIRRRVCVILRNVKFLIKIQVLSFIFFKFIGSIKLS